MPAAPIVMLYPEDAPIDNWWGLNGTSILEGELHERGTWHQPSRRQIIAAAPGAPHVIHARFDDDGAGALDPPLPDLCLDGVAIDLAPFSPIAAIPTESSLVRLATEDERIDRLVLKAPTEPGDWVIRVAIDFDTDPGPSRLESFFRLLVGLPFPAVGGSAPVAKSCTAPGERAPALLLVAPGIDPVAGEIGTVSWRGTASDGGYPTGTRVAVPSGSGLVIKIEDGVCAAGWRFELGPRPRESEADFEPITEIVPSHDGLEDDVSAVKRFELATIPPGDWVVVGRLTFVDRGDRFIGDLLIGWNVVVPS